jgi:hypothetical protein
MNNTAPLHHRKRGRAVLFIAGDHGRAAGAHGVSAGFRDMP